MSAFERESANWFVVNGLPFSCSVVDATTWPPLIVACGTVSCGFAGSPPPTWA